MALEMNPTPHTMKSIMITVTADHISRGVKKDCGSCPVALAISDGVGGGGAWVSNSRLEYHAPDGRLIKARTPRSVQRFVVSFDQWLTVKPFRFRLNPTQ